MPASRFQAQLEAALELLESLDERASSQKLKVSLVTLGDTIRNVQQQIHIRSVSPSPNTCPCCGRPF